MNSPADLPQRYERQQRFAPLGATGQHKLMTARVLICGCGALGCAVADSLVRAGVGWLRIVDRDFVTLENLHRQVLFDEADATQGLPKAVAAASRLSAVNSLVSIDPVVADLQAGNISQLAQGVDLLIDGTDNFETRYLLNDYAHAAGIPWIFAGCVGAAGQTMTIVPGETPCLSCLMPAPPPATDLPTCETTGVLLPVVSLLAALQAMAAIKLLSGQQAALDRQLTVVDLWQNKLRSVGVARSRQPDCLTCGRQEFVWLRGARGAAATRLCGQNAVQIAAGATGPLELPVLAEKLRAVGPVTSNPFLVRLAVDGYQLTIFADGRTIVGGTDDPAVARTVLAKYVGH